MHLYTPIRGSNNPPIFGFIPTYVSLFVTSTTDLFQGQSSKEKGRIEENE